MYGKESERFELGSAPARTRSSKRRLAMAFLTAAALAAVVPALGYALLNDDGPPARKALPVPEAGVVPQKLFSLTTSWGDRASIWSALTSSEGRCAIVQWDDAAGPIRPFHANGSSSACYLDEQTRPINVQLHWRRLDDKTYGVTLLGSVAATSGITRLQLSAMGGEHDLPMTAGIFMIELPRTDAAGVLAGESPHTVVGFAPDGSSVTSYDLDKLVAATTPPGE